MDKLNEMIMKMISFGGEAKSLAFSAIKKAQEGKIDEAESLLAKADEIIILGKQAHLEVLSYEANSDDFKVTTLFVHAADYVSNGSDICLLARYYVDLYKEVKR